MRKLKSTLVNGKLFAFAFLSFFLFFSKSCTFLFEDAIDPEVKEQKDAYNIIIEAHALKQILMYDFFALYSNNFEENMLFKYNPEYEELNAYLSKMELLWDYRKPVQEAIEKIQNTEVSRLSSNELLLKSANANIFSSLIDFFVYGAESGERGRMRILTIVSNLSDEERSYLYNTVLSETFRSQTLNELDFWTKLNNGVFDDATGRIHNDFNTLEQLSTNYAAVSEEKGLRPNEVFYKEGVVYCDKAKTVMIETTKLLPGLGTMTEVAEKTIEFKENIEKAANKPLEYLGDEIKSRTASRLANIVDIDGKADQLGLSNSMKTVGQTLAEISLGSSDPEELMEKSLDWGIAKISAKTGNLKTENIIAERENNPYSFPEIIIGIGDMVNNIGETVMFFPKGNWNMKIVADKQIYTNIPSVNINSQETVEIEIETETELKEDPKYDNKYEVPDSLAIVLRELKIVSLALDDGGSFFRDDHQVRSWQGGSNNETIYPVNVNGNQFTCNYEHKGEDDNGNKKYEVSINGYLNLQGDSIFISTYGSEELTRYYSDGKIKSYYKLEIAVNDFYSGRINIHGIQTSGIGFGMREGPTYHLDDEIDYSYSLETYTDKGNVSNSYYYSSLSENPAGFKAFSFRWRPLNN